MVKMKLKETRVDEQNESETRKIATEKEKNAASAARDRDGFSARARNFN